MQRVRKVFPKLGRITFSENEEKKPLDLILRYEDRDVPLAQRHIAEAAYIVAIVCQLIVVQNCHRRGALLEICKKILKVA